MGVGLEDVVIPCLLTSPSEREDLKGKRWLLCLRVSSLSQLDNTSLDNQDDKLEDAKNRYDGEIVGTYRSAESAASMDRETTNQILRKAQNDEFDILGLWKLDRLTRADPWESISYLHQLQQTDITLYAATHGFLKWDSLYDFRTLCNQVVFAREWYERIQEGAEEGQLRLLRQGKWPFGQAPFGYKKHDDDHIELTERGIKIIPKIFKIFIKTENRAETRRQINEMDELQGNTLSDSQIETILKSKLPLGYLTLKGEVVEYKQSLQVIDEETHQQAQEILVEQEPSQTTVKTVPEAMNRTAQRFGPKYSLEMLSAVTKQCRECGGELGPDGKTEVWGETVKNFSCQDDDCTYDGPLLTAKEYRKFHTTLPLRCPRCPATERFVVTETSSGRWKYVYNCQNCGMEFGSDELPNKVKRAFENPELAIRFDRESTIQEELNLDQSNVDTGADQAVLSQF